MSKKDTIDARIKHTWHAIDRLYNKEAVKHGTTTTTGMVLLNIDPVNGIMATKIGPLLGVDPRSLSRVFESLEAKKLITRKPDKEDARRVIVQLTAAGKKKREIAKEAVKKFNNTVIEKMGEKKYKKLLELMDELFEIVINEK